MANFLVLGLGNLLMNDDAAGLHAVYALQKIFPERADFMILDGGTLGLDLLGQVEWADKLLILDAVDIGVAPGTVIRLDGDDIKPVLETKVSPHQVGLADLLAAADLIAESPRTVTLLGIQAASIMMEMTLSADVAAGLDKLIHEAETLIEDHFRSDHVT